MATVELVFAPAEGPIWHTSHAFQSGMQVETLLALSEIEKTHPEVSRLPCGVFSKLVTKATVLKPGDRVEVYRPRLSCPKEKRRNRVYQR